MNFLKRTLNNTDFEHIDASEEANLHCNLAPDSSVVLNQCHNASSGFSKEWLLRHHYALANRDLNYNHVPPVNIYFIKKG